MVKLGQEFRISCAFCASALSIVRPYFNFHFDDLTNIPALIQGRQPFRHILGPLLVSIHFGAGQGQIQQITGKGLPVSHAGRAKAAVVRLAARHDMLDVRFPGAGEAPAGVRPVDAPPHLVDDLRLYTLWIRVVVRVVWRATVFREQSGGTSE